ncbi:MAG: MAPEG family protein, partial [Methylococcaceae bacterium]|nr:MAPEG family protein [Methylococcaceae bacterium]
MLCVGILGILLFGLGFAVSGARGKFNVGIGVTPDSDHMLNRLVRAHGNTSEYAPFLALMFLLHGIYQPSNLVVGLMVAATAARVIFVVGLLTSVSVRPFHLFGLPFEAHAEFFGRRAMSIPVKWVRHIEAWQQSG